MKYRLILAIALLAGCAAPPPPSETYPVTAPVPPAPAAPEAPAAGFPTTAPVPGPVPSLEIPAPVVRTLPNGLTVMYVEHGSLPIVHAKLITRGGLADDPLAMPGLAAFTAEMLDEGADGLSSLELASELELLGANLNTGVDTDAATVDLHVLRENLPAALRLMADVALRPDFPAAEVERLREESLTALNRARDEPRIVASRAFLSLVYGEDHPYGSLTTLASMAALDRAALESFHERYYRPGSSTLILVGEVSADALDSMVREAFGDWDGGAAAPAAVPTTPEIGPTTIYLVDKPGAAQSEIIIGHPGAARISPDYFPLMVLNTILGGSFTSRLNSNLREEHGYSYGAGSSFAMDRGAGPFMASSAVFTAKTDSALIEFFGELSQIRDESVSQAELERAKNYVALGMPRRFETTRGVANQFSDLIVYDLPLDTYNSYVERIQAVTAADVQRVARQYVRPENAVVVVVGDRSQIEAGIRALDLAPLEIIPIEEVVP
ncbi:MAG TPA: pitrilysin family protein [Longimicrobiaceae bacterium]|nr:pitrilysin family protein [Longimicrobiaceae bacterium]